MGSAGLHHPGHPRFHLSASVTHFGGMLKVMISLDEFIDTIETQFNGHDLLEVANESSIRFRPFAINNNSRTIHLRMPGRIGSGLGGLSAPMFDNFSVLETKQVKRYDRPRKAGPTFVFRVKHDSFTVHNRAIDRDVGFPGILHLSHEGPQAGQSISNIRIVLHERIRKEAINGRGISISKNVDHGLPRFRSQVGDVSVSPGLRVPQRKIAQQARDSNQSGKTWPQRLQAGPGSFHEVPPFDRDAMMIEADLLVIGRASTDGGFSLESIEAALVDSGRPLLISPAAPLATLPETVVIGWKATREAARAVTAALPFLHIAKQIVIMTVAEDQRAPGEETDRLMAGLRWHGVPVSVRHLPAGGQSPADALLTVAREHAALLVMGGYGHSRLREWIFGGFTLHVLRGCEVPVLMAH